MLPLRNHPATLHPDLIVGLQSGDDAGVYRLSKERALVQTVDFFTPIVDEAYDWGRIAAANALSDIYAMGAEPLTAMQMLGWPRDRLPIEAAADVLRGGADKMGEARCTVVGGHSIDSPEPTYGFAVTGLVDPAAVMTSSGARPGDALILTKPLGTGIIATAIKRERCPRGVRDEAVEMMTTLNFEAARLARRLEAHAVTDVTGFGLLGSLVTMLVSTTAARIDVSHVPVIEGVRDLCEQGHYPGGSVRNLEAVQGRLDAGGLDWISVRILADAQTSGGLVMAVHPSKVPADLVPIGWIEAGAGELRLV